MRPNNTLVFNGVSAAITGSSSLIWSTGMIRTTVQISVSSGSLNGTFTLKSSNDLNTDNQVLAGTFYPTNWNTVGGSTSIICSNTVQGSGAFMFGPIELSQEYLRLDFAPGNGGNALGTFSVRLKSQGL